MDDQDAEVRRITLPADARAHGTLRRLDYSDAFLVDTGGAHPGDAEWWARTILEGAPAHFRRRAPLAWRAMGLERGPLTSATSILSWPITHRSDDRVLLGATGRLGMSAELLVEHRGDRSLLFSTMVELRNVPARLAWALIRGYHQGVVRKLLLRARRTAFEDAAIVR